MTDNAAPSKRVFKFVKIPADISEPVQELEQELVPDKEVECLLDRLKEHFRASAPRKTAAQLQAQRAELMKNLPVGQEVDEKILQAATSMQMVENISLLSNSKDNGFVGVNMYVDDEGSIRGAPRNMRATEIAHCCGRQLDVKGDAFLARVLDDGDAFDRLDFTLGELSSSAAWVSAARRQAERRAAQESGAEVLRRMQTPATPAAPAVRELTPAEAAKEEGNAAFGRGDWQAAVERYSAAVELDPGMVAALNNRAMAQLKLAHWAAAEADCSAVLQLEPGNVKALLRRAAAREGAGKADEARADLEAALRAQPQNKEAQARLAALAK